VEGWAGRGVYGAVYRAVPVHDEHADPVALKMALYPEDPRFTREKEVLSRCDDPSIPRLLGQGSWKSPAGKIHPFIAMQWVDGARLYDQARLHPPSQAQVLCWMAQLTHALAVLHAQGALHRDVKGDNVLVRRSDGRAVLMDYGTSIYPGAATLTPPLWFPGTPAYRSPESWLFEWQFQRDATARYRAAPADDLYALGVTACRLLTGEYPELAKPFQDKRGTWHVEGVLLPLALLNDSLVAPPLRVLILRMFSVYPERRGTAAQLSDDMERAMRHLAPESPQRNSAGQAPLPVPVPRQEPAGATAPAQPPNVTPHEAMGPPTRRSWPWLALAVAVLALTVWAWPDASREFLEETTLACVEPQSVDSPETGTGGLAEAAAATSMEQAPPPSGQEAIAEDSPPKPLPGQTRPDEKGRCPRQWQVSLNGGCWELLSRERGSCDLIHGQMFKGLCYVPILAPGRRPTSSPMKEP
jgi:serine/threonine protein kinase